MKRHRAILSFCVGDNAITGGDGSDNHATQSRGIIFPGSQKERSATHCRLCTVRFSCAFSGSKGCSFWTVSRNFAISACMFAKSSGLMRSMPSSVGTFFWALRIISFCLASEDAVPPYNLDCDALLSFALESVLSALACIRALATDLKPEPLPGSRSLHSINKWTECKLKSRQHTQCRREMRKNFAGCFYSFFRSIGCILAGLPDLASIPPSWT